MGMARAKSSRKPPKRLTSIRFLTKIEEMYELRTYTTVEGKDLFTSWQDDLRDTKARLAIRRRLNRATAGNLGDHKPCSDGVWEMRIDFGPGYRIYYSLDGDRIILLLGGGDKSSQAADIRKAVERREEWRSRAHER